MNKDYGWSNKREILRGCDSITDIGDRIDDFFLSSGAANVRHVLQWIRSNPKAKIEIRLLDIDRVHSIFMEYISGMEKLFKQYMILDPKSEVNADAFDKLKKAQDSCGVFIDNLFKGTIRTYDSNAPLLCNAPIKEVVNNIAFLVDFKDILTELNNRMKGFIIKDSYNEDITKLCIGMSNVYSTSVSKYAAMVLTHVIGVVNDAEAAIEEYENRPSNKVYDINSQFQVF